MSRQPSLHFSKPKTRQYPETRLQKAVVQHLALRLADGCEWWASPTGMKMSPRTAAHMKQCGMKAGVPDIEILVKGKFYGLELKSEKGRISPAQDDFFGRLEAAGARVFVAFNLEDALVILANIGAITQMKPSKTTEAA